MAAKTDSAPTSRRSARLAGSAAPPSTTGTASKKRTATSSAAKEGADAKKAKTSSKAAPAPAPAPKSKSKTDAATEEKKAVEEKKAEAPASAKADTGAKGALKKGDKLPKITLQDNTGADVDVSALAGKEGVVIFLYPKADTPGCTNQACGFRDHFDSIKELGYQVYGLSKDKPAAQQKWIDKKQLNYKLLCDPDSKLIKKLGAFVQPNNTKRSHFIFEKGTGKLVDIALGVKPADDPKNCLDFIEKHHA